MRESFRTSSTIWNKDPRETRNLIAEPAHEARIRELRDHLDSYFARYELAEQSGRNIAAMPSYNGGSEPWHVGAPAG